MNIDTQSSINIAVAFAKKWEQLASKSADSTKYFSNPESVSDDTTIYAYPDGKQGYSIGWGTYKKLSDGTDVVSGLSITKAQADNEIVAEMNRVNNQIQNKITADINEYQYAALLDLCYNAGSGALDYKNLIDTINNGGDVASILPTIAITQDGIVLSNLKRRRIDESLLWKGEQDSLYSMYLQNATTINTVAIVGGVAMLAGAFYWYYRKGIIKV